MAGKRPWREGGKCIPDLARATTRWCVKGVEDASFRRRWGRRSVSAAFTAGPAGSQERELAIGRRLAREAMARFRSAHPSPRAGTAFGSPSTAVAALHTHRHVSRIDSAPSPGTFRGAAAECPVVLVVVLSFVVECPERGRRRGRRRGRESLVAAEGHAVILLFRRCPRDEAAVARVPWTLVSAYPTASPAARRLLTAACVVGSETSASL